MCIAFREGWLGGARRNKKSPTRNEAVGLRRAASLLRSCKRNGLAEPYGPAAHALAIGQLQPPSRRAQAPPGDPDAA